MKKGIISCLLACCLTVAAMPAAYGLDDVIANDASGIPDETLYMTLLAQTDADGDGQISRAEASALEQMILLGGDVWEGTELEPIRSLQGLSHFAQVKEIGLYDLTGIDLSPIGQLTNVQSAAVMGMDNACVPVIAGLPKLEEFVIMDLLEEGKISDLSGLSGASALHTLVIANNPVSDLSPLAGLTSLREVGITLTPLSDISPLAGLTELEILMLPGNAITTLPDLTGLHKLTPETTDFTGNHISADELRAKLPAALAEDKAWIISNKYPYAGDLNADDTITIVDVMEACKVLARQSADGEATPDEIDRGDMDGDEKVTITDVMDICKILARNAQYPGI